MIFTSDKDFFKSLYHKNNLFARQKRKKPIIFKVFCKKNAVFLC